MKYTDKIFNMLGVRPYEEFKLNNNKGGKNPTAIYRLSPELELQCNNANYTEWDKSLMLSLVDILNGNVTLCRYVKIDDKELTALKYFKMCGYNYIAKDWDGKIYAYKEKPKKIGLSWEGRCCSRVGVDIKFIKWEDEEPTAIFPGSE